MSSPVSCYADALHLAIGEAPHVLQDAEVLSRLQSLMLRPPLASRWARPTSVADYDCI